MSSPTQRDPDLIEAVRALRAEVAELRASTVGRWGHGPQGLSSQRPAASADLDGVIYWATDTDTLSWCDGTGWIIIYEPAQTYNTFSMNNVTLGDGTRAGWYRRSCGSIDFQLALTFGASTTLGAIGKPVQFLLPVNVTPTKSAGFLVGYLIDASGGQVSPSYWVSGVDSNALTPYYMATVTQINNNGVYAGAPWVWQVNDEITITGRLTMSSPYS